MNDKDLLPLLVLDTLGILGGCAVFYAFSIKCMEPLLTTVFGL